MSWTWREFAALAVIILFIAGFLYYTLPRFLTLQKKIIVDSVEIRLYPHSMRFENIEIENNTIKIIPAQLGEHKEYDFFIYLETNKPIKRIGLKIWSKSKISYVDILTILFNRTEQVNMITIYPNENEYPLGVKVIANENQIFVDTIVPIPGRKINQTLGYRGKGTLIVISATILNIKNPVYIQFLTVKS